MVDCLLCFLVFVCGCFLLFVGVFLGVFDVCLNITCDIDGDINNDIKGDIKKMDFDEQNAEEIRHLRNERHHFHQRKWLRHNAMVPKGFIRYHVLQALSEQPMSGSELMQTIEKQTGGTLETKPRLNLPPTQLATRQRIHQRIANRKRSKTLRTNKNR